MLSKTYKILSIILLSAFAIIVNNYYGSLGVLPINTFSYFDTGFRVLNGEAPFVDYWTISGPFIDFLQSFYFLILGVNWNSYVLNGSIINVAITLVCLSLFLRLGINFKYSVFYSFCFSILANPSMGTPFPDHFSSFF